MSLSASSDGFALLCLSVSFLSVSPEVKPGRSQPLDHQERSAFTSRLIRLVFHSPQPGGREAEDVCGLI